MTLFLVDDLPHVRPVACASWKWNREGTILLRFDILDVVLELTKEVVDFIASPISKARRIMD